MRLIGAEGEQLGVVSLTSALQQAQDLDLDLVEVAPAANPPVCRLLDYGKFKYEQAVREKKARKAQTGDMKSLRMGPNLSEHDYEAKLRQVRDFLSRGHRVKITVRFRGRQNAHPERGRMLIDRFTSDVGETASVEAAARLEGRQMHATFAPSRKADRRQSGGDARAPAP